MKKPYTLIIMDGYGIDNPDPEKNAIAAAKTPVFDELMASCPNCELQASGEDVGLPEGQMGNSEVGHTNMGAGRVVFQILPRITVAIREGTFFKNPEFISAMDSAKANGGALHLFGLMSNGGVHSHNTHTWAFLEMAKQRGLDKVYLHCFMDGRDVPPTSGKEFIEECEAKCKEIGVGKIATVQGRFYAMDRDNRWDRVEKAYNAMVFGEGVQDPDPVHAMQASYDEGVTDEFVLPTVCCKDGLIKEGDSIIFMNFRPDRAREITRTFVDPDFNGFERKKGYFPVKYVCTAQYDASMPNVSVAFPPEELTNTLGEVISSKGMTQLRIAETEKYAHVTFFFNGGTETVCEGEDRCLIPSPKEFATYDLVPEMSARKVADEAVARIESGKYDMIILNFANCDMVGHTGVFPAAVTAVETVDECMGKVVAATEKMGGVSFITADHGNADKMYDTDGSVFTAHTTNPVPFIVKGIGNVKLKNGRLADIAPTMLDAMGIEKPEEMTGSSLIVK
jgi:2,3-bisphosphoglycerate-independent phosphoglycerate mutase